MLPSFLARSACNVQFVASGLRWRYVHTLQSRGVGVFGALGLGDLEDVVHFETVNFGGESPHIVAAGFGHSAITSTDGKLAICGRGFDLGSLFKSYGIYRVLPIFAVWAAKVTLMDRSRSGEILLEPQFYSDLRGHTIKHVCAAGGLTLALTDKGKLFPFGANIFGQCGLGIEKNRIWKPVASISVPPVLWCDTGLQHCICVCEGGEVYCWGKGLNGQMGNNTAEESNIYPIPVTLPVAATTVAAGLNHCVAVGANGRVYIWGRRMSLELEANREHTYKDQMHPREVDLPGGRMATRVYCSSFCTVIIASDGTVWAMGVDEAVSAVHHALLPVLVAFNYDAHPGKTDEELEVLPEYREQYMRKPNDVFKKGYYAVAMIAGGQAVYEVVIAKGVARLQQIEVEPRAPGKIVDFSTGFRHTMIIVDNDDKESAESSGE